MISLLLKFSNLSVNRPIRPASLNLPLLAQAHQDRSKHRQATTKQFKETIRSNHKINVADVNMHTFTTSAFPDDLELDHPRFEYGTLRKIVRKYLEKYGSMNVMKGLVFHDSN